MAKLLLIEDDVGVQDYFKSVAARMGHDLEVVGDGAAGCEKALDESFEIILTDLNLPGTPNGMELVRKIRESRPNCPVVVVSGYPTSERLDECRELGIADFLTKPFEMTFFQNVVTRLLARQEPSMDSSED